MSNILDQILYELQDLKSQVAKIQGRTAQPEAEIINTEELCNRLNISEPTAIKWRKKGKLPSINVGSSIRYNWVSVVAALEKQKSK